MQLEHSFTVPVGVDRTWEILNDIEKVVPCMPGATLRDIDGDRFTGHVKVKVGPMQVTYEGEANFVERDEDNRTATIEAKGDQQRGAGSAHATINARLVEEEDGATTVVVTTELQITGRPAQFGRGVMADVGDKLLGQFADCLEQEIVGPDTEPEAADEPEAEADRGRRDEPVSTERRQTPRAPQTSRTSERKSGAEEESVIDLLEVAGPSVAKRVVPLVAVGLLVALVWWLVRRGDTVGR